MSAQGINLLLPPGVAGNTPSLTQEGSIKGSKVTTIAGIRSKALIDRTVVITKIATCALIGLACVVASAALVGVAIATGGIAFPLVFGVVCALALTGTVSSLILYTYTSKSSTDDWGDCLEDIENEKTEAIKCLSKCPASLEYGSNEVKDDLKLIGELVNERLDANDINGAIALINKASPRIQFLYGLVPDSRYKLGSEAAKKTKKVKGDDGQVREINITSVDFMKKLNEEIMSNPDAFVFGRYKELTKVSDPTKRLKAQELIDELKVHENVGWANRLKISISDYFREKESLSAEDTTPHFHRDRF
ncbi:MAG: hypothetical protein ACOYK9_06700 [Chlamydiia bacterium]